MQKTIQLITGLLFITVAAAAQKADLDTSVTIDMLTVPNSPAFNLLGISPSAIDKPTTPTDFAFSIVNASNNFGSLPKNYALEFQPISLLFPRNKAFEKMYSEKYMDMLSQNFVISTAFTTNDTVNETVPNYIKTRSGIGFKISLWRGEVDTAFKSYKTSLAKADSVLKLLNAKYSAALTQKREADVTYVALNDKQDQIQKLTVELAKKNVITKQQIDSISNSALTPSTDLLKLNTLKESYSADTALYSKYKADLRALLARKAIVEEELKKKFVNTENETARALKKQIENIKYKRYGPMLDLAGGMVLGFRNDDFQNSIVQQYAVWLNGGYIWKKGADVLGLLRYNSNLKSLLDTSAKKMVDVNTVDAGAKFNYTSKDDKFTLGIEGIMRTGNDTVVYRYTFNVSYLLRKNQALTFSIGKNFGSSKATTGGNLIATLNYILTLGSTKEVNLSERD